MNTAMESRLGVAATTLAIAAIGVTGLIVFFSIFTQLVAALYNDSMVIEFNKGAMYLPGGAIAVLFLCAGGVQKIILNKPLTIEREVMLIRGAVIGILIMFVLPQLAHLVVWSNIKKQSYTVCAELNQQWLFYKTYVYVDGTEKCVELVDHGR